MSTSTSPVAPVQTRDIRSASVAYKRDKDHGTKWAHGIRPRAGQSFMHVDEDAYGETVLQGKVRPATGRSYGYVPSILDSYYKMLTTITSAVKKQPHQSCKMNRPFESNDINSLSKSLLSILPQHTNNTAPAIITSVPRDERPDTLYSFDSRGPTPGGKANRVALNGLIEQAEQKWIAEQTEKIIRGEYEVLDAQGEKTNLKKGKKSPKQKAKKVESVVDEDEGFELV
jgi:hypothetical protein